jgi:hypothetical protein
MSWRDVEAHTQSRQLILPSSARGLTQALRALLLRARDTGELSSTHNEILAVLRIRPKPPPGLANKLKARGMSHGAYCIEGGDPTRSRDPDGSHLRRSDGAWFNFSIAVRENDSLLEVLTYRFEICFPTGIGAPFMRFDHNLPEEDAGKPADEPRSHLHPGHDELRVPTPQMSPEELTRILLYELRPERARRRAPTQFEIGWHKDTHALFTGSG